MSETGEPPSGRGALDGRVAAVIGGSSGIGRAVAIALASAGARVALAGRDPGRVAETRSEVVGASAGIPDGSGGADVLAAVVDVRDDDSVSAFATEVNDVLGPVEVLVIAAAVGAHIVDPGVKHLWEADPATWSEMWRTNVDGAYHALRAFAPTLCARGQGAVIGIGSGFAANPKPNNIYGASKAAFRAVLLSAAADLAPYGVALNLVNPGTAVDSGFHRHKTEAERAGLAHPSLVVPPVLWLAEQPTGVVGTEITARGWFAPQSEGDERRVD